ncbi:MAG: efflux RND transporter periplasmic adaptor subunit [Planctomycetota bacterium]|nr:MAG: efflux RND transporter periplasmic adaptor subunit [Planctomycetota bacterium]REJ92110.1 MAG: efflux RND transporter periplasmic adaptor subunit [Planctomycetota bacterium]REK28646.1 MAG: efflux RND transporter periplasmic adaptor subunit [Planctomycetota bacterium]REK39260.1 MAG: efflux RND transporter periplasmic adaptor subunit [Planctomycetota bacterium]
MRTLLSFLRRHWRKVTILVLLVAAGIVYAASPLAREKTHAAWHAALAWAGIGGESVDTDNVFWCPMHPQIKSKKENAVCPICNMALVELEGGIVEAPQHLTLTAQQVQQAGVVTQPVMRRKLYREIDTTGRIDYDERRYAGISSWVTGKSRIDKLHVSFTGETVEKGELIAEIYSPQLISAQEEFVIAVKAAREREGRTTGRSSFGLDPEAIVSSARQKLLYQGMTTEQVDQLAERQQIWDRIPVHAPISGTVIERHVQEGQYVNEGDWLFHLADLSHLWLFVDIFEDELSLVEVGTPVELSVSSQRGQTFSGTVSYIEPKVRRLTRTAPVRIDVDNRDGKLLPGMFARARLRHQYSSLLAIPENAVLWSGQRAVVMIKNGEGTFLPREVQLGRKWLYSNDSGATGNSTLGFGNDRVRYHEVLADLTPGEEVVTAGAFLLNAESQFQNVLAKMLPPESQRATLKQVVGEPIAQRIRRVLDAYFQLSKTLAADDLDAVPAQMATLSESTSALAIIASESDTDALKADATRFHELVARLSAESPKDAVDARTRFGRISHELTKLLEAHGGKTLFGHDLYQFECGMAKVGYERWLWWSPEIHNPYMGQRMLKCGTRLDALEP